MWRWAIIIACCAVCAICAVTTLKAIDSRDVCGTINRNAIALRELIMHNARASKRYGTITLGGQKSTYAMRLAEGRRMAKAIGGCP